MAAMRHLPWLTFLLFLACERGEAVNPFDARPTPEAGPLDAAPPPPPDAVLDQAVFDAEPDVLELDFGPRDAEVDFEPFEAGAPPYDLDAAHDPTTLAIEIIQDWQPVLGGVARQKRVSITLDVLPSGRTLRVPLLYVAPTQGCPCNFFVVDGGHTPEVRAIDEITEALIGTRVGMVAVGIAPLADLGEEGVAAHEELLALLNETGDLRRTELWLWGQAYLRAATAALTETDTFSPSRIGAAGRSRGGIAASTAVIHDPRFVALNTWLAPLSQLPEGALPETPALRGTARRRLQFDAERMSMPIHHARALDERRVDLLMHLASNDLQTPGLLEAGSIDREFPICIEPNVGHGVVFRPQGAPVPVGQPFLDNRLSLLEFSLGRGSRQMTPPLISARIVDGTLTVLARFRTVPRPNNATLWFTYDRAPDRDRLYEESVWENVPMSRLDNATFVATLPVPEGPLTMDAFTYHTDQVNGRTRHVTSAYARFDLHPEE